MFQCKLIITLSVCVLLNVAFQLKQEKSCLKGLKIKYICLQTVINYCITIFNKMKYKNKHRNTN